MFWVDYISPIRGLDRVAFIQLMSDGMFIFLFVMSLTYLDCNEVAIVFHGIPFEAYGLGIGIPMI